ncbi:MAG: hypothetical protein FJX42_05675 [Alphaproteobacteria bacterium]|nr:hypothetical protein [Alphaproteobacteria bacterium]
MTSDILVFFKTPPTGQVLTQAKEALMAVDRSVLAHKPDGPGRTLLVKFDPARVTPAGLLAALRAAGLDVSIAGG